MPLRIVYQLPNGTSAVISPAEGSGLTIEEIAAKDVPVGTPYSIVEDSDLPEPSLPVPQEMSFAQMLIGLVAEGWITQAEGMAWLGGNVPAPVSALIAQLPQSQQFAALARAVRPSVVLRNDPLVAGLAALQGKTDVQMDDFFRTYASV